MAGLVSKSPFVTHLGWLNETISTTGIATGIGTTVIIIFIAVVTFFTSFYFSIAALWQETATGWVATTRLVDKVPFIANFWVLDNFVTATGVSTGIRTGITIVVVAIITLFIPVLNTIATTGFGTISTTLVTRFAEITLLLWVFDSIPTAWCSAIIAAGIVIILIPIIACFIGLVYFSVAATRFRHHSGTISPTSAGDYIIVGFAVIALFHILLYNTITATSLSAIHASVVGVVIGIVTLFALFRTHFSIATIWKVNDNTSFWITDLIFSNAPLTIAIFAFFDHTIAALRGCCSSTITVALVWLAIVRGTIIARF
jgi:hypothetical protein